MKIIKHLQATVAITLLTAMLAGCGGNNDSSSGGSNTASSGSNSATPNNTSTTSSGSGDSATQPSSDDSSASGAYTSFAVSDNSIYTTSLGFYYYIGIVKNTGNQTARNIQMLLVDDSGTTLDSSAAPEATLALAILPPGKQAGFRIQSEKQIGKPSFKVSSKTIADNDNLLPAQLSIANDKLAPGDKGNEMKVDGEIKNDSDKPAIAVTVIASGYDDSGKLVEITTARGIIGGESGIPAKGTATFEAVFATGNYGNKAAKVARYEVFASGLQNLVTK